MEQPRNPENGPSGFTEIYRHFSHYLQQRGDFSHSWDRMRDSESSLGLPRGFNTSFNVNLSRNELTQNPHRYHSIWTEFMPSHIDEEGDFNPEALSAHVAFTEKSSRTFFLSLEEGVVRTVVVTTDLDGGGQTSRKGNQLNDGDVELLRRIFETISANLA